MNVDPVSMQIGALTLHVRSDARVAIVRCPFSAPALADFRPVVDGTTLEDLAPVAAGAWVCQVDDRFVLREDWHYAVPPGALVIFRELPQGGGNGKASLRILLTLAVMWATAGAGGALLGINGAAAVGAVGVQIANAVVTGLAVMAVQSLVPLDASNAPGSGGGGVQQFSGQVQQNIARIGQPIPEIFGYDNGWPDLAAQPYATYATNQQYLHVILCIGRGQYQIDGVAVGDTPLTSFSEAQVIRLGPAQDTLTGPGTGYAAGTAQTLVDPLMTVCDEVSGIDCKTLDYAGPFAACRPERSLTAIHIDMALPVGLDSGREIVWKVEVQSIDDFGAPTSAWSVLATETYNTASAVPVRLSFTYTPASSNRRRVRILRTDTRSTDDGSRHDLTWLGLRASISQPGHLVVFDGGFSFTPTPTELDLDECTFVVIKILVSGQLSGAMRFRVKSRRMLPIWNGSTWSAPTLTRNPAWALAHVLDAREVPDEQIDLETLLTRATTWDARQDRFDFRFDGQLTTWDALAMIARVGNAVPLIRGSRYTFPRDELQSAPTALFGMRNIRRGSFALDFTFPESDPVEAIDLEYNDHRRWGPVTVTAQLHEGEIYGYRGDAERAYLGIDEPDPLRRASIRMPGVIGEIHATRIAVRMLAEGLYRRMHANYSTELDGLLPAPLDLIVVQHDVGSFGQGGDVADWDEDTLTLSTTEPLAWEAGATHYVRLSRPDGRLAAAIAVEPGTTDHEMVLASAPIFSLLSDDAGRERTRYAFGPADNVGALAKLRTIAPRSALEIEHRVVLEDDRVHTADNAWLPSGSEQDPLTNSFVFFDGGMSGAPVPDDAGSERIVNLFDIDQRHYETGSPAEVFTISFLNDGRLYTFPDPQYIALSWLVPQTVTPAVAALYEVYVQGTEPGGGFFGGTLDTWLNLGTSRSFTWTGSTSDLGSADEALFTVSIRDVATATVQGSMTMRPGFIRF